MRVTEKTTRFIGVSFLEGVPSIYKDKKGDLVPLPAHMCYLRTAAANALVAAYNEIVAEGGGLYISDMYRSPEMQDKANENYKRKLKIWIDGGKVGAKPPYSPPSGKSMHEACSAIDIAIDDKFTKIGHARVRAILNSHGFTQAKQGGNPNVAAPLTGNEAWHYDYYGEYLDYKNINGHEATVKKIIRDIKNVFVSNLFPTTARMAQIILKVAGLYTGVIDGNFGPMSKHALVKYQSANRLYADGVLGPKTWESFRATVNNFLSGPKKTDFLNLYFPEVGFTGMPHDNILMMLAKTNNKGYTVEDGMKFLRAEIIKK